jgi:hypothetical protein
MSSETTTTTIQPAPAEPAPRLCASCERVIPEGEAIIDEYVSDEEICLDCGIDFEQARQLERYLEMCHG